MSLLGRKYLGKRSLLSDNTFKNDLPKYKKNFYTTMLKYMDQYSIYNYLKVTDPHFGFKFADNETLFLEANVSTTLELLLYFSRHKDDTDVNEDKLDVIKKDLNEGKYGDLNA
jgi:hypothetical protein